MRLCKVKRYRCGWWSRVMLCSVYCFNSHVYSWKQPTAGFDYEQTNYRHFQYNWDYARQLGTAYPLVCVVFLPCKIDKHFQLRILLRWGKDQQSSFPRARNLNTSNKPSVPGKLSQNVNVYPSDMISGDNYYQQSVSITTAQLTFFFSSSGHSSKPVGSSPIEVTLNEPRQIQLADPTVPSDGNQISRFHQTRKRGSWDEHRYLTHMTSNPWLSYQEQPNQTGGYSPVRFSFSERTQLVRIRQRYFPTEIITLSPHVDVLALRWSTRILCNLFWVVFINSIVLKRRVIAKS